ncbi:hypothetical protein PM082_008818 [Marasmius tenuissimus]|nr:hypothetical protein PM082_008818 [Marasmius tenuissimus]
MATVNGILCRLAISPSQPFSAVSSVFLSTHRNELVNQPNHRIELPISSIPATRIRLRPARIPMSDGDTYDVVLGSDWLKTVSQITSINIEQILVSVPPSVPLVALVAQAHSTGLPMPTPHSSSLPRHLRTYLPTHPPVTNVVGGSSPPAAFEQHTHSQPVSKQPPLIPAASSYNAAYPTHFAATSSPSSFHSHSPSSSSASATIPAFLCPSLTRPATGGYARLLEYRSMQAGPSVQRALSKLANPTLSDFLSNENCSQYIFNRDVASLRVILNDHLVPMDTLDLSECQAALAQHILSGSCFGSAETSRACGHLASSYSSKAHLQFAVCNALLTYMPSFEGSQRSTLCKSLGMPECTGVVDHILTLRTRLIDETSYSLEESVATLHKMKISALHAFSQAHGIAVTSRTTKDQSLSLITDHLSSGKCTLERGATGLPLGCHASQRQLFHHDKMDHPTKEETCVALLTMMTRKLSGSGLVRLIHHLELRVSIQGHQQQPSIRQLRRTVYNYIKKVRAGNVGKILSV